MHAQTPSTPSQDQRLEALEYFLGQALLALEADSVAMHARLDRLEAALKKAAPGALAPATEEESTQPFTLQALGDWMQTALRAMRAHQSVTAQQMVAIGETTTRVLGLGESLAPEPQPAIAPAVHAAVAKAKRPPPQA